VIFLVHPFQLYNLFFSSCKQFNRFIHQRTGRIPKNAYLFQLAFQHKSLYPGITQNNERLELLGDAILSAVVTDYLYRSYPEQTEGFLTEIKSRLVSRSQLNQIAQTLGLNQYVQADISEEDLQRNAILGNTLEALTGAVYLDGGYTAARKFIEKKIIKDVINLEDVIQTDDNYKSKLVEWAQHVGKEVRFKQLKAETINGHQYFTCGAYMDDQLVGQGSGYSKKEAEQLAAKEALATWSNEHHSN